jgi:hypothetical protein
MRAWVATACLLSSALAAEPQFGSEKYIEYRPGTLPLVISMPHGGTLKPESIPSRTAGRIAQDSNTADLGERIAAVCQKELGGTPHLIFCHLHRLKLDANREIKEAAQGNPIAEKAWHEFQGYVKTALSQVSQKQQQGLYIDLHGHRHPEMLVELGYAILPSQLRSLEDSMAGSSSLKQLDQTSPTTFTDLIRGPTSLGAILEKAGFPSIPSPSFPAPKVEQEYYNGGYNTQTHSATPGVSALQIEAPQRGVRDTAEHRQAFAQGLVASLRSWWPIHYGRELR